MSLVDRVKAITLRPQEEWRVMEDAPADLKTAERLVSICPQFDAELKGH